MKPSVNFQNKTNPCLVLRRAELLALEERLEVVSVVVGEVARPLPVLVVRRHLLLLPPPPTAATGDGLLNG